MGESIWAGRAQLPHREPLAGNREVDAAVIGGGMAGVLTAYYLQQAGLKTLVLERERAGSGQTKNTTAKITAQHGLIYHRLIERLGQERAWLYAGANQQAVGEYRRLVREHRIECELSDSPAYLYATGGSGALERERDAARQLGLEASLGPARELPFPASALCFPNQARFHPLKFLRAVAGRLELCEQTEVRSVEGNTVFTSHGQVKARHIIFACHYPFLNIPGFYFMRMHQERSYVLALKDAARIEGMYLGVEEDGLSLRPQGDLLLLGGGNHRTGENSPGGAFRRLRQAAETYWPGSREVAAWSAQDCMTLDGVPYIGRFSPSTPDWYVATGFRKWGMSTSMVSALLLRELIVQGSSPWEEVFSPQRWTPSASAKTLMQEMAQAAKGLTRSFLTMPKADIEALPAGHGGVVEYDGEKAGVYKEENGEVFIVSVRCPHLGCQLEWNPDERSWDCPCHGSRFDYRGNRIDGPAQESLERA